MQDEKKDSTLEPKKAAAPKPPEKTTYVYVGARTEIGGVVLDKIGQLISLTPESYSGMCHKVALLTEDEFKSIGFTDVELSKFGKMGRRAVSPESFRAKVAQAQELYRSKRGKVN